VHIEGLYAHVAIQYRTPTQLGLQHRFHQTLKTDEVYWRLYKKPGEARQSLLVFHRTHKELCPHWAFGAAGRRCGDTGRLYMHGRMMKLLTWQRWAGESRERLQAMFASVHLPFGRCAPEVEAVIRYRLTLTRSQVRRVLFISE